MAKVTVNLATKAEKKEKLASGATRSDSTGKGRPSLASPFADRRLWKLFERGAISHGERNWQNGVPFSRVVDGVERHFNQWLAGERDEDHLIAAYWGIHVLAHFEEMILRGLLPASLNDLPDYSPKKKGKPLTNGRDYSNVHITPAMVNRLTREGFKFFKEQEHPQTDAKHGIEFMTDATRKVMAAGFKRADKEKQKTSERQTKPEKTHAKPPASRSPHMMS